MPFPGRWPRARIAGAGCTLAGATHSLGRRGQGGRWPAQCRSGPPPEIASCPEGLRKWGQEMGSWPIRSIVNSTQARHSEHPERRGAEREHRPGEGNVLIGSVQHIHLESEGPGRRSGREERGRHGSARTRTTSRARGVGKAGRLRQPGRRARIHGEKPSLDPNAGG